MYRVPPAIRLADFTEHMKARYGSELGANNVVILKNKPLEDNTLDPRINYIQIVSCEVYFENLDEFGGAEPGFLHKSFGVNTFVFETPYDPDGNNKGAPTEDVARLWKRKIIVTTSETFPHCLTRSVIAHKVEVRNLAPFPPNLFMADSYLLLGFPRLSRSRSLSLSLSHHQKLLTPIESAIDVVSSIVSKLRSALNCTPPDAKRLQIVLQGSILTRA